MFRFVPHVVKDRSPFPTPNFAPAIHRMMLNVQRDLGIGLYIYDELPRGAGLFCNQRSRVLPLERLMIFPVFCRQSIQVACSSSNSFRDQADREQESSM